MGFEDHFGGVAASYAAARPGYPEALFDWLAGLAPACRLAWDCACGSGQAARPLAGRFARVVATDASLRQLAAAVQGDGIGYAVGEAGAAPLPAGSVDLVTVAQALHWFAGEAFFAEVRRVAAPGAVLAAWTYALPSLGGDAAEAAMLRFYADVVGPYWPPERRLVMEGYRSLELPFEEITPPPFEMTAEWSLDRFLGLLRSWSASARFRRARGFDPVDDLARELGPLWGEAGAVRRVSWPLTVRALRV